MTRAGSRSGARAVVDLARGAVVATVDIEAPASRVFRALSEPRELMAWWGSPDTYRAHTWVADFRVGGLWRVDGTSADGKAYSVTGEFLEITPPRRIVQTWAYDWDAGRPSTMLTYELDDVPGGTRVTVRHEGFAPGGEACRSHGAGWEMVLGWLVAHLERSG